MLTEQIVRPVFGLESRDIDDPITGKLMISLGRHGGRSSEHNVFYPALDAVPQEPSQRE